MIVRASSASKIAIALNALGVKQFGLSLVALALILTIVFWLRPNVASYNGLRLLLNLSPVLVFAALAHGVRQRSGTDGRDVCGAI